MQRWFICYHIMATVTPPNMLVSLAPASVSTTCRVLLVHIVIYPICVMQASTRVFQVSILDAFLPAFLPTFWAQLLMPRAIERRLVQRSQVLLHGRVVGELALE